MRQSYHINPVQSDEGIYNISVGTILSHVSLTDLKLKDNIPSYAIANDVLLNEKQHNKECKEPLWKCRYTIVMIAFLLCSYVTYTRLNMSISLVAMVNNTATLYHKAIESDSCPNLKRNSTENETKNIMEGEFNWSPKLQGYIQGSYYVGYLISLIPGGYLVERYGSKWFLFGTSLVPGVCNLLIPALSYISAYALMVLSVIIGFAQGLVLPGLNVLAINWLPKQERGFLLGFIYAGAAPGCCAGSILAGYICDSIIGWPGAFYVTGTGMILLSAAVLIYVAENPKVHSRISKAELDFILSNQENVLLERRPKLPWRKMLKSVPVYAVAYGTFGHIWALTHFWTVNSTFLSTILHYPISENGLLSAAPFFLQFFGSQVAALISLYMQKKELAGINFLRKFWNFIACLGVSACLFGTYLAGCNRTLSVVFATLSMAAEGVAFQGAFIAASDMTPTFAGTLYAICCTAGVSGSILFPVLVGYLTDETQNIEQWNKVFFITIGIVMSSGIVFAIFGSADIQKWNFVEEKTPENHNEKTKNIKHNNEDKDDTQT